MKALHIRDGAAGGSVAVALSLPFFVVEGEAADAEAFHRQARGEAPYEQRALYTASRGIRAMRTSGIMPRGASDHRVLTIVISGGVDLSLAGGGREHLEPGDIFLAETSNGRGHEITRRGDCRTLEILVPDAWAPEGTMPPEIPRPRPSGVRPPNIKRMFKAGDNRSYFEPLDTLFADGNDSPGPWKPMVGFWFVSFPPGFLIDWHPEVVNNFCVVLQGEMELETGGGGGAIERFQAGDICQAQDRTGEGHIDRMHGVTCLALVELEDEHLW